MKSFTEIGQELNVSKQRAKQIYDEALKKLENNMSKEEIEEFHSLLSDMERENNMHDQVTDAMFQQTLGTNDLQGFWNDREEANTK